VTGARIRRGQVAWTLLAVVAALAAIILYPSLYTVDEREQVVITEFGKPVRTVTEPGLHARIPFIQVVHRFSDQILPWDGDPNQIPTKDNKFIWVDAFARWRITDALVFYRAVESERGAQARLDDVLDGAIRDEITQHLLVEVVRRSDRPVEVEIFEEIGIGPSGEGEAAVRVPQEEPVALEQLREEQIAGKRGEITRSILERVRQKFQDLGAGIEIVDLRIKRINYVDEVRDRVHARMISQQERVAERYRAVGEGWKQEIQGRTERRLREITSEAQRKAQTIRGRADAEATRIYAEAYGRDPEFFRFVKTLETYPETLEGSTLILTTDSPYLSPLKEGR
jgi:membrane protease subunit HflC